MCINQLCENVKFRDWNWKNGSCYARPALVPPTPTGLSEGNRNASTEIVHGMEPDLNECSTVIAKLWPFINWAACNGHGLGCANMSAPNPTIRLRKHNHSGTHTHTHSRPQLAEQIERDRSGNCRVRGTAPHSCDYVILHAILFKLHAIIAIRHSSHGTRPPAIPSPRVSEHPVSPARCRQIESVTIGNVS